MPDSPEDTAAIAAALSAPRFDRYLAETGGDPVAALALYDWNARVSAAFLHMLHVFEVVLRNGVVAAVEAEHGPNWHLSPLFIGSLPRAKSGYGAREDLTATTAKITRELLRSRPRHLPLPVPPPGKVVAELRFMFWISMLTARHDGRIWSRHLHIGFPRAPKPRPGSLLPRRRLHDEAEAVRILRNRIAHHEPIFGRDLRGDCARILRVIRWRNREAADWLNRRQCVTILVGQRPYVSPPGWARRPRRFTRGNDSLLKYDNKPLDCLGAVRYSPRHWFSLTLITKII